MAITPVFPLVNNPTYEFEQPISFYSTQEGLVAAGFYPQKSTTLHSAPTVTTGVEYDSGDAYLVVKTEGTKISFQMSGNEYAFIDANGVNAGKLDAPAGVALTIGGTNATGITIGKSGVNVGILGNPTFTGGLQVMGTWETIQRSENDSTSRTCVRFVRGSGAGADASINTENSGVNDVSALSFYVNASERGRIDSTGFKASSFDVVSGALTVGGTSATGITLGKAGVIVNAPGTLRMAGSTVWTAANDGSGSGLDADLLDGHDTSYFQTALTNPLTASAEYSVSATVAGWYTIATVAQNLGRAHATFYVYDATSGHHDMVELRASTAFGKNSITAQAGLSYSTSISGARILYDSNANPNPDNRTYGGAKLQVYVSNPTITLTVRMFGGYLSSWSYWTAQTPVQEDAPVGWAEDTDSRLNHIAEKCSVAYGFLAGIGGLDTHDSTTALVLGGTNASGVTLSHAGSGVTIPGNDTIQNLLLTGGATGAKMRFHTISAAPAITTNAAYASGSWGPPDDQTKKQFAYLQHITSGRHEFRTSPAGASVGWINTLVMDDTTATFASGITVNVTSTLQEAGSRVWTAATFDPSTKAAIGQTMYIGTTGVTINRASANLALTGISSITLPGATSGTCQLIPAAVAGTGTVLTLPATTGTVALTSQLPTVNDAGLTLQIGTAGATNTSITIGTGTGFTANDASPTTYDIKVGPGITALVGQMTGATAGFLKKTAQDTLSIDTSTYALNNQTMYIGTTGVAINRGSGSLDLAGIGSLGVNTIESTVFTIQRPGGAGGSGYNNIYLKTSYLRVEYVDDTTPAFVLTVSSGGVASLTLNGQIQCTGVTTSEARNSPTFINSWVNYGGGFSTAVYWKDPNNVVHLEGLIKSGILSSPAFTLPAGYRPTLTQIFCVQTNPGGVAGRVDVSITGTVTPGTGCSNAWVSLDGISFYAGN